MNGMFLGRRGQTDWKWIVGVVVGVVIISAVLLIWQAATTGPAFPATPEEYAKAWGDYGDFAFKTEDQPWRLMSIFFFPLIAYFSLFFFAVNLVFASQGQIRNWEYVQKPLIVFSFAIAFIILPFPLTFQLYQILGGVTVMVPLFVWIVIITAFILLIYHARSHAGGAVTRPGGPTAPRGAPTTPRQQQQQFQQANINLNRVVIQIGNERSRLMNLITS